MKDKYSVNFKFISKDYPTDPGCYIMKNDKGKVIYVGKAKNFRRRLSSYFQKKRKDYKTARLVPKIADIEVIIVNSEIESLILENNLIKLYRPRYNRQFIRNEYGYPHIVLTGEKYPRLLPYRRNRFNRQYEKSKGKIEGSRFGPYLQLAFRDAVMNFTIDKFKLRACNPLSKKVCLRYEIGTCSGICELKISPEEYDESIRQVKSFLSYDYNYSELVSLMRDEMNEYARKLEYEKAGKLRDRIRTIEEVLEKQIVERDVKYDQDVIWFEENYVMILKLILGMLQQAKFFHLDNDKNYTKAREDFLLANYQKECPGELIINELVDPDRIRKALSIQNQHDICISIQKKGIKNELLLLCKKNYIYRKSLIQIQAES